MGSNLVFMDLIRLGRVILSLGLTCVRLSLVDLTWFGFRFCGRMNWIKS